MFMGLGIKEWLEVLGRMIEMGAAVTVPLWALFEIRGRKIWLTRDEWRQFKPSEYVSRREWEMAQKSQAERLAEVVVAPLKKIAERLDALAQAWTRQEEINRSIGRSLDQLREELQDARKHNGGAA